jgi:O-antigen ligase
LYLDKSIENEWYYVPFIMAIVCVVLTLSISAYAATCVGFITYFALKRRLRLMFILVLLMASSVAILFANFPMMGNILEIRSANLESGSGRYDLWRYALSLFEEHPVFGVGTNGLKFYTASRFDIVNVHSTFIEILVESGIVGSIIYLLFILMFIVELIKKRKTIRRLPFLAATLVSLFIVMFSVSATIQQAYLFILLLSYTYLSATSIISSNMTTQFKRYCG